MASKIGMTFRNEAADRRIVAAFAKIQAQGRVQLPELVKPVRDPILLETLQREWLAAALEAIADTEPDPEPVAVIAPQDSTGPSDFNDPTEEKVVEKMVRRQRRQRIA